MQLLVIYLAADIDANGSAEFAVCAEAGAIIDQGRLQLRELAKMGVGRRSLVLIDGAEVLLTTVEAGNISANKLRMALPALLEEQLCADVEELHFAIGDKHDGHSQVLVIAKARLQDYLQVLQAAGIYADYMLPSSLALPYSQQRWGALLSADSLQVRYAPCAAFTAPLAELDQYLQLAGASADTELAVAGASDCDAAWQQLNCSAMAVHKLEVPRQVVALAQQLPPKLASYNLLQGEFVAKRRQNALWSNWRFTSILAAVLLLVYITVTWLGALDTRKRADLLQQQIGKRYLQAFPGSRLLDVSLIKTQIDSKLKALGGGERSNSTALIYQSLQVLTQSELKLLSLDFVNNGLQLELGAADMQALDNYKQQLLRKGLNAQISSANNRDGQTIGRIKVN